MFSNLEQQCDLCRQKINVGEEYGVLVFNIEELNRTAEYPDGVVTVKNSEIVNTMCLNCASKYNNESIKQLLD